MLTDPLRYYRYRLESDGCSKPGRAATLMQNDTISGDGPDDLVGLGRELIARLGLPALALYEPALPFYNTLIAVAGGAGSIVPTDTETRTFLHDIPIVRAADVPADPLPLLTRLLEQRKGILVENLGVIASGPVTVEQAYINASSLFHATFVKYLLEHLQRDGGSPDERMTIARMRDDWLLPLTYPNPALRSQALTDPAVIQHEMIRAGQATVATRLVDSSFGNISCRSGDTLFISQTGASLDALEGCIDPVALDNSSTCGITASSELLAHRLIYDRIGDGVILHGHPKFAIIMSMDCRRGDCTHAECWNSCPEPRAIQDIPIVPGEIGAGGLAEKVSPVISRTGKVIVFGHGVFTCGRDFNEAFAALLQTEQVCRDEYFRRTGANS